MEFGCSECNKSFGCSECNNGFGCSECNRVNSRPRLGRGLSFREANRKSEKLFPFEKMAEKDGGIPMHLTLNSLSTRDENS